MVNGQRSAGGGEFRPVRAPLCAAYEGWVQDGMLVIFNAGYRHRRFLGPAWCIACRPGPE